jgi:hypothetical protein
MDQGNDTEILAIRTPGLSDGPLPEKILAFSERRPPTISQ